jgi:hypothetical protein
MSGLQPLERIQPLIRGCVLFGCAAMWCGQAPLCPGQCVVPAIEDPRAELAKGWAAAASRLGGERLCFNWEAGLCERFCRSAACQQRI